jgi:nucleoside-diphosphate-sugar epimerase
MLKSNKNYSVYGLDSNLYERCTFGSEIPDIPWIRKDIRDVELKDVEGFDAILHLAGLSNDPLGDLNPDLTMDINYRASVRLAELAKRAKVKQFIFSSSCSNYGAAGEDMVDENSEFHPVTPYGKSKVLVEQELSQMADDEFSPTYLRNATAYGVSPRLRFDLVVNNLTAWAYTTKKVFLKGDGTAWRPLVHIRDISRAFLSVLQTPRERVHNEAFNIGQSTENYRIRDLAEVVSQVVPESRVEFAAGATADTRCYRVSCDKALKVLQDFTPSWNIRTGAEELYEAYVKTGITLEEFEGPRYKRVAHIKLLLEQGILNEDLRHAAGQIPVQTDELIAAQ